MVKIMVTCTFSLLVLLLVAEAQQPTKISRIGYLSGTSLHATQERVEAFRQGLRDLGYVEDQNVHIAYRWAEGRDAQLLELATELVHLKVDVIVAVAGTLPALAAKQATNTIPVVFVTGSDPVEAGLVPSLTRPGGNLTGLGPAGTELPGKRLELLKEAVPKIRRVAILWNPANPGHRSGLPTLEATAQRLGLQLQLHGVHKPHEFDHAFAAMRKGGAEALYVFADSMFLTQRTHIAALAIQGHLPTIYNPRAYVEAGGLMSYGQDDRETNRRAAVYVDKILQGAKPGELPVEQAAPVLWLNLKTAEALGLTIPTSVRFRADAVIQEAARAADPF